MNKPSSCIRLLAAGLALALLPVVPRAAAQAPAPASLRSAQVDPSGELLILKYGGPDGTPDNVAAVSGQATLTVNGTPTALTRWLHGGHGWLAFALSDHKKYARVVDDEDRGDGVIVATGAWTTASNGVAGDNFRPGETSVGSHFLRSADPAARVAYTYKGCVPGPHRLYHMLWDRMDTDRSPDSVYTVKSGSGTVLGTFHVDLRYTGSNPMWPRFDHTRGGNDWTTVGEVTLPAGQDTLVVEVANGAGSGTLVADGLLLRNVLVPRAGPGDVVTLDIPAGVVATASGPQPAVVARPVTFATDADLMPYDPGRPKTLRAGYNKEGEAASGVALLAADRGPFTWGWRALNFGDAVTVDDRGEMTSLKGSAFRRINSADLNYVDGRMLLRIPDGQRLRLEFDYAGDFNAEVRAGQTFRLMQGARADKDTSVNGDGYEHLGGTRWRLWVTLHHSPWTPSSAGYPFLPWGMHDVDFIVRHPITGFSLFDDRTPVDWAKFTHPHEVERLGGKGLTVRLMDLMATNYSPVVEWSDYYPEDATGRDVLPLRYEQPVLSVEPIDRGDKDLDGALPWFGNSNFNAIVKVTVASTAGLVDGHTLQFSPDGQQIPADAAVRAGTPGAVVVLTNPIVVPLNDTQLLVSVFMNGGSPGPSPSTCAPGVHKLAPGTTLYKVRPAQHPRIAARMCADLGASPWYCLPHLCSDRYVRDWADMALSVHPAGTRIQVEYSNEIWNFPASFQYVSLQTRHANYLNRLDPVAHPLTFNNGFAWGAWRSDQLRRIALARFTAAGRASDLYWILGTQTGNPGAVTAPMVRWGATQAPPVELHFDGLALETYQNFGQVQDHALVTSDTDIDAFYDRLSPDGQISLATCSVLDGGRDVSTKYHRDLLDANGFGATEVVSYEGGWDHLSIRGTVDDTTAAAQEISRSPRMFRFTLAEWEMCDRAGFRERCRYTSDYGGGVTSKEVWCDFPWTYCQLGTGDPAENPHPWDYDGTAFKIGRPVVSQMGGGLLAWAAGMTTAPIPRPPTGHTMTVRFVASSGPVSDHMVTVRDAAGAVVPGLDRKSTGGQDSLNFDVGPGTYTATVEAVNLAPDPARPVYSDPASSAPFTVPVAVPNARPPAPSGVVVTDRPGEPMPTSRR